MHQLVSLTSLGPLIEQVILCCVFCSLHLVYVQEVLAEFLTADTYAQLLNKNLKKSGLFYFKIFHS